MKRIVILIAFLLIPGGLRPGFSQNSSSTDAQPSAAALQEQIKALERRLQILERLLKSQIEAAQALGRPVPPEGPTLEEIDQKVRIVDRRREIFEEDLAAKAKEAPVVTAGTDGFTLQSNDGDHRLTFGLVAQTDGRFSLDNPKPITNTFTIRKIRPTFTGRVGKYFEFKVMPDFGSGTTIIQDAYFDIRFSRAFRVRVGKDKTPVGYELLQGDGYLLFPERALASSLVPNRDIGIQAQGDLAGGKLFYAGGVFNGIPDGTSASTELDTNNKKDITGRIVLQPFASRKTPTGVLSGLGFQVGGSRGNQTGALPSFKTSVGQTYFSYSSIAAASGDHRRVSPAVFYYYKAFGAFAEYMRSTQAVTGAGIQSDVRNQAWEVTGSFLLTGETASERGVRPKHNFDPAEGSWGALQLLARYTTLMVDPRVFASGFAAATANRKAQSFTIGANWYPTAFIKVYGTFERTAFSVGPPRPPENVILFRTQLGF